MLALDRNKLIQSHVQLFARVSFVIFQLKVKTMTSLKHITTVYANGRIPVHKYKSELTGLTVVIGEVEGPLVNGFFTLGKH